MTETLFDAYARSYDAALQHGLSASGESKEFFARGRVQWLARRLSEIDVKPTTLLDFGCGTGSSVPYFFDILGPEKVIGVDVSAESIDVARHTHGGDRAIFVTSADFVPQANVDVVFTNGVFHHISPAERPAAIHWIHSALRRGGVLAFWENNPWNPGTRYIMSRIPFDRDAVLVWPHRFRRALSHAGFDVISTDYQFIFPRWLRQWRCLEPYLRRWPLGGQYLMLARKR